MSNPNLKAKVRRKKPTTDPEGFLVVTRHPYGCYHVVHCKTDAGVALSRKEDDRASALGYKSKTIVVGMTALMRWMEAEKDELEILFSLPAPEGPK